VLVLSVLAVSIKSVLVLCVQDAAALHAIDSGGSTLIDVILKLLIHILNVMCHSSLCHVDGRRQTLGMLMSALCSGLVCIV